VLPAGMRRAEGVAEGIPAAGDTPVAVVDSRVEEGNRGVVEDSPAVAGIPGVEDSPAEGDTPRVVEDNRVVADIPAAEDSPVEAGTRVAVDSRVGADTLVGVGSPAAVAGTPAVAAYRRRSYRTWRKRCCPGLPGSGSWGRP